LETRFALRGRRALITGGSRGIGAAIACRLAAGGADVAIVGRDRCRLEVTRAAVEAEGRKCALIEGDLSTVGGARSVAESALAHAEHWDILVNNAGIATSQPLIEIDHEAWDLTLAVNVRAALVIAQRLVPPMLERRSGKVINVSSLGAFLGTPGLGAYAASKAALNQLTRTMAVEWGPFNVQVNAVCPTVILTDMGHGVWDDAARASEREEKERRIPAHRFGEPEDVADAVAYLASPASDFINGVSLPIDGGLLVMP
jgi:NAD(P)-dependent dehydrogenase (short-subunit alcohol dehydrogenase family)